MVALSCFLVFCLVAEVESSSGDGPQKNTHDFYRSMRHTPLRFEEQTLGGTAEYFKWSENTRMSTLRRCKYLVNLYLWQLLPLGASVHLQR